MGDVRMWVVVLWVVVLVVAFVTYARGPEHHRGDEVGAQSRAGVTTERW